MLYRLEEPTIGICEGLVVRLPVCDWGLKHDLEMASVSSSLDINALALSSRLMHGCGTLW